jgi:hypothetical protein
VGEAVLDVQPKLGARVRLLAAGSSNKNDPNDARSVATAALRSTTPRQVAAEDHAAPSRLITPVNSMGDQHLACRASLLRPATQGRQVPAGAVADGHDPLGTYVFGPSPFAIGPAGSPPTSRVLRLRAAWFVTSAGNTAILGPSAQLPAYLNTYAAPKSVVCDPEVC